MKRATVILLLAAILTSVMPACFPVVRGSGQLATRDFDFSGFTSVEIGSTFQFQITRSDAYSVRITADDNLFDYINVSMQDTTLEIGLERGGFRSITLRASVSMPQLRSLRSSGATHGTASGFASAEDLAVNVSGASSLNLTGISAGDADFSVSGASSLDLTGVSAGAVKLNISGASRVKGGIAAGGVELNVAGASRAELAGSANDLVLKADGASTADLADFPVRNASIRLSGAGSATVNLTGTLNADLSGGSTLRYIGEPTIGTINISGGSRLIKA